MAEVHSMSQELIAGSVPQALLWIHGLGLLQGNPPAPVELELSAGTAGALQLHHGMAVSIQSACCLTKVNEQLYRLSPGEQIHQLPHFHYTSWQSQSTLHLPAVNADDSRELLQKMPEILCCTKQW